MSDEFTYQELINEIPKLAAINAANNAIIRQLEQQLKEAEAEIKALIALSGGEFNCDTYFEKYKNDNN